MIGYSVRRSRFAVVIMAIAVAIVVSGAVVLVGAPIRDRPASPDPSDPGIVFVEGADRLPSDTAADWVTYADHIVVVTAAEETEIPPSREEMDIGEGLIGRDMRLRVDKVVWSRRHAARPAPESVVWHAPGWTFSDGATSRRTTMLYEDEPRVEEGHHYVVALDWVGAKCAAGDGEWLGLGEGGLVPYDHASIGAGENEGKIVSTPQARRSARRPGPDPGLEDTLVGQDASDLARALNDAKPVNRPSAFHGC
ncbi:hypothetical protein [Solicola gregarius]|uniref:Uncharacterized protein n=1 Tax=Solicola gregarius TaxID=2908642 RepID=A0AA46TLQ5_9ACTN|nr:hypothetical protein [Solicola gregarius]UYM07591.1 hypothetical protein L0C25_11115 [Solicola gregarius]